MVRANIPKNVGSVGMPEKGFCSAAIASLNVSKATVFNINNTHY